MTNLQNKIVDTARTLIHLPQSKYKHFSFICERNRIITIGWNDSFCTHPIAKKFRHRFSCIHSELSAISKFPYSIKRLSKAKFINVRLNINGELALSKPCLSCQYMLYSFSIKTISYSTSEGFLRLQL